ncbi:hypothetical protein [Acinetobacter bohemicus]|uniref:hypothetical protein n=1 Tax=Acinetobacter bohemicus TaxID=1435036 RepID=UPI001A5BEE75|nr:hypothetical protein [Acinetobacter bohemicus]CAD9194163.1 hypothetical protein QAC21B_00250 [Acinetobacter bohemicus]CAD9194904.1 hypothetical protein QAC21B_01005 [Acinetobacter bohemicus]
MDSINQDLDNGYRQILTQSEILLKLLKSYYEQLNSDNCESVVRQINKYKLEKFTISTKFLLQTLIETLKDSEFKKSYNIKMFDKHFLSVLANATSFFAMNRDLISNLLTLEDFIFETTIKIIELESWITNFRAYMHEAIGYQYAIIDLNRQNDLMSEQLARYTNTVKNKPAVALYDNINKNFENLEKKYRKYFLTSIVITLFLAIAYDPLLGIGGNVHSFACSINQNLVSGCAEIVKSKLYPFNSDSLKYILYKLAILIVGVTLTTYFLRLSSFYQLKQEQAKQTKLELEAFPDYVSGMDKSVANNLRQELALKYFGKEIDQTQTDKIGDLMKDQLSAGTELIRASAELVKAKGESKPNS